MTPVAALSMMIKGELYKIISRMLTITTILKTVNVMCWLQRYAQTSVLKRSIFELIAAELVKTMTEQLSGASPEPSRHADQDLDAL